MRLFINHIPFVIESLNDLKTIDTTQLNNNQLKAFFFIEKWYKEEPFTFHSSGSTGIPKAFTFAKSDVVWSATQTIEYLNLVDDKHHFFICLDIGLVAGAMLLARAILLNADITIVSPSSNPFQAIDVNHAYTITSLVPMQIQVILAEANGAGILNKFKHILLGGAPIHAQLNAAIQQLDCEVWHTYGMTETLSHIALRNIKRDAEFHLLPNNFIALDERHCLKIKNIVTQNKWLQTNDIVIISKQTFMVVGRYDFIINSGGFKVNALKVEEEILIYLNQQQIQNVVFFISSIPDDLLGQKVVLVIKQGAFAKQLFESLQTALKQVLHPYEVPKEMVEVPRFFYTLSQKLDRNKIMLQIK
ncbi:MAG: AMP-binding protein [Bacteroidota bacterium]